MENGIKKTVKQIQSEINALESKKYAIEKVLKEENEIKLVEELLNFIDGIGIIEEDYYAPKRLYSSIEGVKNIRMGDNNRVIVKTLNLKGELLPDKIEIRGNEYDIAIRRSKNFSESLNY